MNKILQDKYENQTKITDVKPLEQIWLGWRDSNPRMHGPKPCALPLGDTPSLTIIHCTIGGGQIKPRNLALLTRRMRPHTP